MRTTRQAKYSDPECQCGRPVWDGCPRCRVGPHWAKQLRAKAGIPEPIPAAEVQRIKRALIENPDIFAPIIAGLLQRFKERK